MHDSFDPDTCFRRRLRADLLAEAESPRLRSVSSGRCCGTGPGWSASAPSCSTGSTPWPPTTGMTGPAETAAAASVQCLA